MGKNKKHQQVRRTKRQQALRLERVRQRRRQRLLVTALLVAIAGISVVSYVAFTGGTSDERTTELALDFELETPTGETVSLSDYRGRPVAVTFMHSW